MLKEDNKKDKEDNNTNLLWSLSPFCLSHNKLDTINTIAF